jgi:hypothetical protein
MFSSRPTNGTIPYRSLADLIYPWAVIKGQCHEIFYFRFFSTTPAANLATGTAGVVDTGGNLPPVLTTPVLGAWGETEKNLKSKISWHCPIMSANELSKKNKF